MRYFALTVLSFLTLSSAYGQSGESCRFAPDPTLRSRKSMPDMIASICGQYVRNRTTDRFRFIFCLQDDQKFRLPGEQ